MLSAVDSLEFIILVDNVVEWMTRLPPEFSSEVRLHMESKPPIDSLTGVPILDLDHYCCGAHGLAVLIKTTLNGKTYHTLFDTGPDGDSLARNLDSLKINLTSIDNVVLSHWHRDHSGGILRFLQRRKEAALQTQDVAPINIDLHPSRPVARGIAPPPTFNKVLARLPHDPGFEEIEALGGVVRRNNEAHALQGDTVYVSGEIPRITQWETGILGGMRWVHEEGAPEESGNWIPEQEIFDERYAAVDVAGKGLVLFSSCSHAGICNVIADAQKRFQRPIYTVVGGLHLVGAEMAPRIAPTVSFIKENVSPSPKYIIPLHCSGFVARVALAEAFGEAIIPGGVGMRARFDKA